MIPSISALVRKGRFAMLPRDAQAVLADRLTYLTPQKLRRLIEAVKDIADRDVQGDLLEFGVALGGSAIIIAKHASPERQFHGFDVFGMIPPPTSDKDDVRSRERYEIISSGKSKGIGGDTYYGYRSDLFEGVCASLARHGQPVDGRRIFLHQGLFEETWPAYESGSIAFAHVDCDWYEPVRFCLNAILPRLAPGGIVILDDYHDYGGCHTATTEFLAENPGAFALQDGANLILRRRASR